MKIKNFLKNNWQTGVIPMGIGLVLLIITIKLLVSNTDPAAVTLITFVLTLVFLGVGLSKIELEEDSNESNHIHPHWY